MEHKFEQGGTVCLVCESEPLAAWEWELLGEDEMSSKCEGIEGLVKTLRGKLLDQETLKQGYRALLNNAKAAEEKEWTRRCQEAIESRRFRTTIEEVVNSVIWDQITAQEAIAKLAKILSL